MKILLVYPKYPETFWSFKHALKFIGKKATFPPLGLLTVAAMLPSDWQKKLVDMNVENLKDSDIKWADYIFISAMLVQQESVSELVKLCKSFSKKIVVGGPLFTAGYQEFKEVDHFILDEAEVTLPLFLSDLEKGSPKKIYRSEEKLGLGSTPIPLWSLIDTKKYASMNIQYSRGCPFSCDFCDISLLFGKRQRTKDRDQLVAELDSLCNTGWRGGVFFVDDNFIGNKDKLKKEILPSLIEWRKEKKYPFTFSTEASVNLADDEELMDLMVKAGFGVVFLGIETPEEDSLTECGKFHNKNRDLISCIKRIQRKGMEVQGGFIVGFDNDKPSIFERQIQLIQKSGIITAMVGILGALRGTKLYHRLEGEKRLLKEASGDNTDFSINFVPKMDREILSAGYKKIVSTIYSPKCYYQRVANFLKEYRIKVKIKVRFRFYYLRAFFHSLWLFGIRERGQIYFWKLIFWTLINRPKSFPQAIIFAIQGYHFRKVYEKYF